MTHVSVCCAAPVSAAGLASVVNEMEDFNVSGTFSRLDVLEEQLRAKPTDLVILELTPAVTLNAIKRLATSISPGSLILWVGAAPAEFLSQALESGVRGILGRSSPLTFHIECLREVTMGNAWVDREISHGLLSMNQISVTPRERQVLGLLAQGLRNKEIAWSLGITEGTVKVYLSRLFAKVGVSDRFELALLALRNIAASPAGFSDRVSVAAGSPAAPLGFPVAISRNAAEAHAR